VSDETELLAANEAFYAAFRARSMAAMEAIWSARADLLCVHPGWAPLLGREAVLGSWQRILSNAGNPRLIARDARVIPMGEGACVLCIEVAGEGSMVATNLFVREDGRWRLLSHHAGPVASAAPPPPPPPERKGVLH